MRSLHKLYEVNAYKEVLSVSPHVLLEVVGSILKTVGWIT